MMINKKAFSICSSSLVLALSLGACSSSSTTTASKDASKSNPPSNQANSSPSPAAPAGGSGQQVVIKFGHGSAESNSRHKAALKFKELVEKKTNGKVQVEVYPNEVLGGEAKMLQSVQSDLIQMTAGGTGIYTNLNKDIGIVELPYMFDSFEQAWKVLDGPFGKQISQPLLEKGVRILSYWENGFRQVTNNKKPIEKPADLAGMKIRTPQIPVSLSIFKALGANPTPMNFGELYQALEQKVVDGQENPLTNIYASKFYEVQKYVSITNHQYSPLPLSISEKFWQSLTPDIQKALEESGKEAGQYHRDLVKEDDNKLKGELETKGMKVNQPDPEAFKEAVSPVYKEYEEIYGKELMDKLKKAISEAK